MGRRFEIDIDYEQSFARVTTPLGLLTVQVKEDHVFYYLFGHVCSPDAGAARIAEMTDQEAQGLVQILGNRSFVGPFLYEFFRKFQVSDDALEKATVALNVAHGTPYEEEFRSIASKLAMLDLMETDRLERHMQSNAPLELVTRLIRHAFRRAREMSHQSQQQARQPTL